MTTPLSINHPGFCRDQKSVSAGSASGEKWSRGKSVLFIASASALSWLLIASPFILLG